MLLPQTVTQAAYYWSYLLYKWFSRDLYDAPLVGTRAGRHRWQRVWKPAGQKCTWVLEIANLFSGRCGGTLQSPSSPAHLVTKTPAAVSYDIHAHMHMPWMVTRRNLTQQEIPRLCSDSTGRQSPRGLAWVLWQAVAWRWTYSIIYFMPPFSPR